jgi:hypothetical protein
VVTGAVAALAWVACTQEPATQGESTEPDASNVILASAMINMPTPMAASELPDPESQGAQLTAAYCGQACHGLPAPSAHSASDWPVVLRRMWLRMTHLDSAYQIAVPSTGERAVIMDYLLANALQVSVGDLPDAPGRALFAEKCSACHDLPDVRQHTPDDWVAVVRRMNGRMENLIGRVLSQDELQRIVLYLEAASRQ